MHVEQIVSHVLSVTMISSDSVAALGIGWKCSLPEQTANNVGGLLSHQLVGGRVPSAINLARQLAFAPKLLELMMPADDFDRR